MVVKVGHRFLCESMQSSYSSASRPPGSMMETVSLCAGASCHAAEHFSEKTSHRIPSCNTSNCPGELLASSSSQVTLLLTFTGITAVPGNDHLRILHITSLLSASVPGTPGEANLHQLQPAEHTRRK